MLRRALKADAAVVHALLWTAKAEIPLTGGFPSCEWVEYYCKQRAVWVVQRGGEIAGVMVMQVNEIRYVVVSNNHRRKGIGRELIARAKKLCINHRWDTLTARARRTNTPILQLLSAEGFQLDPILQGNAPGWDVYSWVRPVRRPSAR
jgi:GNAT superfamily N-acetyltransferase